MAPVAAEAARQARGAQWQRPWTWRAQRGGGGGLPCAGEVGSLECGRGGGCGGGWMAAGGRGCGHKDGWGCGRSCGESWLSGWHGAGETLGGSVADGRTEDGRAEAERVGDRPAGAAICTHRVTTSREAQRSASPRRVPSRSPPHATEPALVRASPAIPPLRNASGAHGLIPLSRPALPLPPCLHAPPQSWRGQGPLLRECVPPLACRRAPAIVLLRRVPPLHTPLSCRPQL